MSKPRAPITDREIILIWTSAIVGVAAKALYDSMIPVYRTGFNMPELAHQIIDPAIGFVIFTGSMLFFTIAFIAASSWIMRKLFHSTGI